MRIVLEWLMLVVSDLNVESGSIALRMSLR